MSKIAVILIDNRDLDSFLKSLTRMPEEFKKNFEELCYFEDEKAYEKILLPATPELSHVKFTALKPLRRSNSAIKKKIAFDYVVERGCDAVLVVDPQFQNVSLERMLRLFIENKATLVLGDAVAEMNARTRFNIGLGLLNRGLGLNLQSFEHRLKLYSTRALKGIPYGLNKEDESFDFELLIQCRAWGGMILESLWNKPKPNQMIYKPVLSVLRSLVQIVRYRLHQLQILRDARYFLKFPHRYGLKESVFSSHSLILNLVNGGESQVLDVGCGPGLLANLLKYRGNKVTGIDIMEKNPSDSFEEYQSVDLERETAWKLGRQFDYILLADVLEHLRNPEQVLRNSMRLLKPNGRLIASTGNIAIWYYRLSLLLGRFNYGERGILDRGHVHLYTVRNFKKLLQQHGFTILRTYYSNIPFELALESTGRSFMVRWLDKAYAFFVKIWPSMFAFQIVIEAEMRGYDSVEQKEAFFKMPNLLPSEEPLHI